MSLKNIIGQEKAVGMLSGVIMRQRVASSYLFCGERGIGKKTTALNFAKALNCQQPELQADACDVCESCIKIDAGSHPDLLVISPEERQIRIEEIRMIDDILSFKPFEGRKKIVLVDDAETMNISAANAFLKTLEEPPEDSLIILISSRPDLLPATIRSRCSRINFAPLSAEACRRVLSEKVPEQGLELTARLSMGRPGLALSMDLMEERTWFLNLFRDMLGAEKDGWASREDMEKWFEYALIFLRDMAVYAVTGGTSGLINNDLLEYLARLSKSIDVKVIINIYNELSLLKKLLMFNLNKSITWNYTASLLRREISVQNA